MENQTPPNPPAVLPEQPPPQPSIAQPPPPPPPVKKRLGRPPKSSYANNAAAAGAGGAGAPPPRRLGRPPLWTPGRIGRPPGPARLLQLQQLGLLPPNYVPPSQRDHRDREAATEREKRKEKMTVPASLAECGLTGCVVMRYPPHPWRWSPGFRHGEIVWIEMTHPLVRASRSNTTPADGHAPNSQVLWPVMVVDRWITDPRSSYDPRLALIENAAKNTAGFTVSLAPEDAVCGFNQGAHIDVLDTLEAMQVDAVGWEDDVEEEVASEEARPMILVEDVTGAVEGRSGPPKIVLDARDDDSKNSSQSVSQNVTPSSSVEASDVSDVESDMPVKAKPVVVAPPQKRGRFRQSYKNLMSAHVPLQDATGATVNEVAGEGTGVSAPLKVHYVVRPLPLKEDAWREGPGEETSGVMKGCFYRKAEEVLPFALYNPDCREDVLWNVAAMEALDIAGSWGAPKSETENRSEPEECSVWGAVIDGMKVPPRPCDAAWDYTFGRDRDHAVAPHSYNKYLALKQTSTVSSEDEKDSGTENEPGEPAEAQPPTKKVVEDVWGLKKEPTLLQPLLRLIGQSNWCGNDALRAPKLERDEVFLQRFRLGSERIQVGDLVRLSGKSKEGRGAYGRMSSRKAFVVPDRRDYDRLLTEQRKRLSKSGLSGADGAFDLVRSMDGDGKPATPQSSITLKINENGLAVVETAEGVAMDESSVAYRQSADYQKPYGITLPSTDGLDYLEVAYIVLQRPAPSPLLAWRGNLSSSVLAKVAAGPGTAPSVKPTVYLTGRVYHRIPSDGRASRSVPLWYPTGEVRTVNAVAGEVLCRAHSQFPNPVLTGLSASGGSGGWNVIQTLGSTTTTWPINVGGVGVGWKGSGGVEESTFSGERLNADDILRSKYQAEF